MPNQNPEQQARDRIDAQLRATGWAIQDKNAINFHDGEGEGQAVREYHTDTGPADYVLFVDGKPVGVIEAKKETLGHNLTTVEDQTAEYGSAKLKWIQKTGVPLPFLYEATGVVTRFTDQRDPKPRSREVFSFLRPETLRELLALGNSLRTRLQGLPPLDPTDLRDCQINAITKLDVSLKAARPRALVQMATGSGKTFTAITAIYRLLKFSRAKRILFLVDTRNLGEQAEQENPAEARPRRKEPFPVAYSEKVPIEHFDFIVIDECHRSIYNLWRQVIEYFDAFLVGLTATPDNRTYAFFKQNVVSEYTHEQAVADGVNVGNEVFLIETEVTQNGGTVLKGLVEKREKLTRAKRWEQEDKDISPTQKILGLLKNLRNLNYLPNHPNGSAPIHSKYTATSLHEGGGLLCIPELL